MKIMMVDIETLSTSVNALVLQVGICVMDTKDGSFSEAIELNLDPELQGRDIDFATVAWWIGQNQSVSKKVFLNRGDLTPPSVVYQTIHGLMQNCEEIWANPPSFDLSILKTLFQRHGFSEPWPHQVQRCLRTARALRDPNGEMAPPFNPTAHSALSDAVWQAQYLFNMGVHRED